VLQEPLTEKEISFLESYSDPTALTECLIPENIKAPHIWSDPDCHCVKLRNYQFAMQNYSYMYANDESLTSKQNFKNKKGAGKLINVASRNIGKSFLLIIDAFFTLLYGEADESCISSFDFKHLKKISTPIANLANYHPFFKIFKRKGKSNVRFTGGGMEIDTVPGHVMYGKNEKVEGNEPGTDFHGIHAKWWGIEEASYMSNEGTEKRIDSIHSEGCIERISGIPDIRIDSPLGKIMANPKNQPYICNLPQMIREDWDLDTKAEMIEKYNGESSYGYKLNVLGEVIEGAQGYWDMERLRKATRYGKTGNKVKFFEIDKVKYHKLDQVLIIDRVPCEQCYIASDIGTLGSPSEIIIIFYDGEKYKYHYNIALYKLSTYEQAQVFKWIYDRLGGGFIALDGTNADGRSIIDDLIRLGVPADDIISVRFNKNIEVDFLKDENGKVERDKQGNPLMKSENTLDWAMARMEKLFYEGSMEIPQQEKFIANFSNFIVKQTGMRRSYGSLTGEDHLHQSVPKDEIVLCKIQNQIVSDTIENIEKQASIVLVPTYDNGVVSWKPGKIIKEKNKGNKILDFKFKPTKNLRVTEGHSMLVWDSQQMQLIEKVAKDVKVGDYCLSAQNLNIELPTDYLVSPIIYYIGKGHKEIKKDLLIDEDVAYFLGWCCAEGSQSGDGSYTLALGLKDPRKKLSNLIKKIFGVKPRVYVNPPRALIVLKGGRGLTQWIYSHVGRFAKTKKFPTIILNSKISVQQAFLKGLIEGDGTDSGKLTTTTSRNVANGMITSHSLMNKHTAFYYLKNKFNNIEYYLKEAVRNRYFSNIPYKVLPFNYSKKTGKTISRKKIDKANYKWLPKSNINKDILPKITDFEFIEIIDIKSYDYDDYIYDLSVEGTHNFLAGVGNIVVHNSFQCFAIGQFLNEFRQQIAKPRKKRCLGTFKNKGE